MQQGADAQGSAAPQVGSAHPPLLPCVCSPDACLHGLTRSTAAAPACREASLEVIGADMKPVPLSRAFRWIPKTATAVRLWSLQRLSLRGLAIECRPVSSIDDVLACMVQGEHALASSENAAVPACAVPA